MKIVTAFDLGVFVARAGIEKSAENPLVTTTANYYRDQNAQKMNRPAPLNIPGAAANAFSGIGSAIRSGAQMAASPPQLPSWALNYRPAQASAPASRIATSRQPLPSYGAGGDPLDPNPLPQVNPALQAARDYHQNLAKQRATPKDPFQPTDLTNPANAYHAEMARQKVLRGPNVASR